jgi:hypothetical protein
MHSDLFTTITMVFIVIVVFIPYVVIPGLHVLLFRSPLVQTTCDRVDSQPRWTDDLPVSVVGVVIWLGVTGICVLGMSLAGWAVFFGYLLTGVGAVLFGVGATAISFILARSAARRHPLAWWGTLIFVVINIAGWTSTFALVSIEDFYHQTGLMTESQIEAMAFLFGPLKTLTLWSGGAILVFIVGFLAMIKKHFTGQTSS